MSSKLIGPKRNRHTVPLLTIPLVSICLIVLLSSDWIRPVASASSGNAHSVPTASRTVSNVGPAPSASNKPSKLSPELSAATKPILLTDPVPDPQQAGVTWFAPTGHTLRGKFLDYWQQYGGLAQFGYPLTEEFFEPSGPDKSPLQVQYFERNRFELHPENQPPYDVELGTLSREFRAQDPPAAQLPSPALYFPETWHNISGKFLEYWQSHGGLVVHGYPITEPQMEQSTNGKEYLVQWFERSRLELHAENAGSPHEVLLGVLGKQLSEKKGYPFGWYPEYGRAADFSWVAGYLYHHPLCPSPVPCFDAFVYEPTDSVPKAYVIPFGYTWDSLLSRQYLQWCCWNYVLIGHLAGPGSLGDVPCGTALPCYYVGQVQRNPAR